MGYKRYAYGVVPSDPTTLNTLGSTYIYPGYQSLPVVNVNTRFTLGNSLDAFTRAVNENEELVDNLNWVKGKHNFQFGIDYLHLQYLNVRTNVGRFDFFGNPGYTNAQASDFPSRWAWSISPALATRSASPPYRTRCINMRRTLGASPTGLRSTWAYVMKLRLAVVSTQRTGCYIPCSRLSINACFQTHRPTWRFVQEIPAHSTLARSMPQDFTNVSPRIGLAYDVFGNGKNAIRVGFGTFYDAIPATIVGLTQPYTYRAGYQYPNGSFTNPLIGLPAIPAPYSGQGPATFTDTRIP